VLTYEAIAAWAGADNITTVTPETTLGWQIPEEHKTMLATIGIPIVDQLIETVAFQTEPHPALPTSSGKLLYKLTENHHGNLVPGLTWSFGVEPGTGTVYYVLPAGDAWFANSSIEHWLSTLHHYGSHVHESPILNDADEHEEEALDELRRLAEDLKQIDPPAFEGYLGYIWAEFLERWLW
jgi:hypothetical protein